MTRQVIIDCDPGVDDILALLLALTSPDYEILAYIPQFGNTDVDDAYNNILKLYGVLDRHFKQLPEDISRFPAFKRHTTSRRPILTKGAKGPLSGAVHTAKYFHGADGLGDVTTKHASEIPLPDPAALSHLLDIDNAGESGYKTILKLLEEQADGSVTYIALGPLTNLALALRENKELFKRKVSLISIMGGALDIPGNTSPVAEFNVYADATAAHEVFSHSSTLPIYLAPLDITTEHVLPWSSYTDLVDPSFPREPPSTSLPPIAYFTSAFLSHTEAVMKKYGKTAMELHDPLAVWYAMQAEAGKLTEGWETEKREFVVERSGEYTLGMCVVDRRGGSPKNEKGKSRAEIQEQLDAELRVKESKGRTGSSSGVEPARVQVDEPQQADLQESQGVNVIVKTPGSEALVKAMLAGIWGAKV